MLNESCLELAHKMSQDHTKRFLDDDWFAEETTGLAIFKNVNAVLIGRIIQRVEVASNAVIVVEIIEGLIPEELPSLLYHQRGYVLPGDRL
jgi:flavin reductase (DIM6/NTAB) family NADH-FMN oxidoreductase RutF